MDKQINKEEKPEIEEAVFEIGPRFFSKIKENENIEIKEV